jgi:PHD/YefM family antitoxin component YafN of YafNO toxin-antitoxin module
LGRLERGDVRVPVARKGRPAAMLISMSEYARLRAIDESPHAEIIGRLLFAR